MNNCEIERKFLVRGDFKAAAVSSTRIRQAYINQAGERTVRIRIRDDKAYLTIKGPSTDGVSRFEWETAIPVEDAEQLMELRVTAVIDKRRFLVPFGGHTWEVDEFYGENEGLTMAEVELSAPDEAFERPDWLGAEVTGDYHYYNSYISRHPYKEWAE